MTNDADVSDLHELLSVQKLTMDIVCHWFVFWCVQCLVFLSPCSLLTMESFPLARHLSPSQWSLTLALPTSGFPPPFAAALRVVCTNILFKYSLLPMLTLDPTWEVHLEHYTFQSLMWINMHQYIICRIRQDLSSIMYARVNLIFLFMFLHWCR